MIDEIHPLDSPFPGETLEEYLERQKERAIAELDPEELEKDGAVAREEQREKRPSRHSER